MIELYTRINDIFGFYYLRKNDWDRILNFHWAFADLLLLFEAHLYGRKGKEALSSILGINSINLPECTEEAYRNEA